MNYTLHQLDILVGGKEYTNKTKMLSKKRINDLALLYREYGSATRKAMERHLEENRVKNLNQVGCWRYSNIVF